MDVAVAVSSDTEAESLGFQLAQSGYRLREALEDMNTGYVSTLRFNHPRDPQTAENPTIDVLISTSGIEKETVAEATVMVSQSGSKVRVAQIPHLIAMKVLSESEDRGKDRWDLDTLIGFASSRELQRANELVGLIEKRGYNRDKDLQGTLRSFIARHRSKDQGIDL